MLKDINVEEIMEMSVKSITAITAGEIIDI